MKIRALLVEDNPDDAELALHELGAAGYECDWERVDRPDAFRAAIQHQAWDVVLSDFNMPHFSATDALEILKASGQDVPFVIVSGSVGEAVAVQAMKAGAHDFFAKSNLHRLGAAIEREINEARVRRERLHALGELRRAEERYRLIIENVRDYAIFMLDERGQVASWNRGAERITGFREDEVSGRPLGTLLAEGAPSSGAPGDPVAGMAADGSADERTFVRRDGTSFWALFTLDPIRVDGQLVGYSAILRDVSERRRLLDDLEQAVRARDEFLSIASHELKTPLTSLTLQLDSLTELGAQGTALRLADGKVGRKLELVRRQAERLGVLVDNLLDVTRITSGRLELRPERLDLHALVEAVIGRMRALIERAGCALSLHGEAGIVGSWDRLRIETVVENLVTNAIKYGAEQPVEVSTRRDGPVARFCVRDRGIGVSPDERSRIFQRFERAVPETHYGGFGLGLWVAGQVVEAHGGAIRIDSVPGEGSTFTVELPLGHEEPA